MYLPAVDLQPGLTAGDIYEIAIDSVEFGRIAAQAAKQVIVQKVREAERAQVVEAYRHRIGELLNGQVKKVTREAVIIDLGNNAEAILPREEWVPRETFRIGDRLRALLKEVRPEARGPQLAMTRTSAEVLTELFKIEVPEVADGIIEILGAARDTGLAGCAGDRGGAGIDRRQSCGDFAGMVGGNAAQSGEARDGGVVSGCTAITARNAAAGRDP